jgi:hypothetical protein
MTEISAKRFLWLDYGPMGEISAYHASKTANSRLWTTGYESQEVFGHIFPIFQMCVAVLAMYFEDLQQ